MTERAFDISVPGTQLEVHGLLREVANAPMVVFVHGFTGHRNEHQFYNGARALEKAGFSTYRFDLYGDAPRQRRFIDCSVQDHVNDLDLVVRTFKGQAPNRPVSIVGHSLGGIVTLCSAERAFDAAVLWDPAHPRHASEQNAVWVDSLGCWKSPGHVDTLVGDSLFSSWAEAPVDGMVQEFDLPTKVVVAGAGTLKETGLNYAAAIPGPHEFVVVPDADHCFYRGETARVLFAETVAWLEKYGR